MITQHLSADALVQRLRDTLAARSGDPSDVLVHERRVEAQPAKLGVLRPHLPPPLARALVANGIQQLYAHQVQTIEALRERRNVVLASPTASGKSLAFALPTLERVLTEPSNRAIYLYPTKALIGDQLRALRALTDGLPEHLRPRVAVLTGDTPRHERHALAADPPAILLANPDILHHSLLPDHRRWRQLLANLSVVVVDELHAYRGVFGAHVSLVMRRLRRLAAAYGAQPTFIGASATIANPVELAEHVIGLPFQQVVGDAAGSGPRRFLFWRPPLLGDISANEHESVFSESAAVFAEALQAGYSGILFGRARVSVERMLLDVRRLVGGDLAGRVSAYKSGYRAEERAEIEAGLRSGALRGVVSTNALELGIDVGALDVAVLAGYPGSSMSFWQQAGRVGRRTDREALVVLVAGDDALDQYHIQHPAAFFGQAMEHAAVDPSNASIQVGHLVCAAAEKPLEPQELDLFPSNAARLVERLASAGELTAEPPFRSVGVGEKVHSDVSLRGTSRDPYTLVAGRLRLGSIEPPYLQRECYPGALYLHNGRGYRVSSVDAATRVVTLVDESPETRTTPIVEVQVAPRDEPLATRTITLGETETEIAVSVGPLRVREAVIGYRESARRQSFTAQLDEPLETVLDTVGVWIDVPQTLEADNGSLHALEHALVNAIPLGLLCDRRDMGSQSDENRVYVYDFAEGGIGLADKAYHVLETLLEQAATLLRECPCADGCPSCMHLSGCPRGNGGLDKTGGLALLEGRNVPAARTVAWMRGAMTSADADVDVANAGADPEGRTFGGRRGTGEFSAPRAPRRSFRAIADEDLRERYGGKPAWLEEMHMAQHETVGMVIVWHIARGTAEVQSLQGGEHFWTPISQLRPPPPLRKQ